MFQVRWEFEVRPEHAEKLARAYRPAGPWVKLFQHGAAYLGTELSQIAPHRWITTDRWDSRASYEAFRTAHAAAYAEIDARCESLTVAERLLAECRS